VIAAQEALQRLLEGSRRFVAGDVREGSGERAALRKALSGGQRPFAAVLGCSDSRVPPEIVFDQDLGDLFVVRVAGNIAGPAEVGSIEYAVGELAVRLVIVLGHSGCGAVAAAVGRVVHAVEETSPSLRSILDPIRPSVEALVGGGAENDSTAFRDAVVRANVHASVRALRARSEVLRDLVEAESLLIIGAIYLLETGTVEVLDESAGAVEVESFPKGGEEES
jgi:carbonic anhydrase